MFKLFKKKKETGFTNMDLIEKVHEKFIIIVSTDEPVLEVFLTISRNIFISALLTKNTPIFTVSNKMFYNDDFTSIYSESLKSTLLSTDKSVKLTFEKMQKDVPLDLKNALKRLINSRDHYVNETLKLCGFLV